MYIYLFAVPIFFFEFWPVYTSFLVFEGMVGMFNSCSGILRSRYYPDSLQSTIMTIFRFPLNILVVIGTKLSDNGEKDLVFAVMSGMFGIAVGLQICLNFINNSNNCNDNNVNVNVKL